MKKIKLLFWRKRSSSQEEKPTASSWRITNDNLIENREQVLAKARQFLADREAGVASRGQLALRASIIGLIVVLIFGGWAGWRLYRKGDTSQLLYQVARVVPLPVANVDGHFALFRDYLAHYSSSKDFLVKSGVVDLDSPESQQKLNVYRQKSLENAVEAAYARKLADEHDVKVTEEQVNNHILKLLKEVYPDRPTINKADQAMAEHFGLGAEYRESMVKNPLLIREVSLKIDTKARKLAEQIHQKAKSEAGALDAIAAAYQNQKVTFIDSGDVPHNNSDNGLTERAIGLEKDQVSEIFATDIVSGANGGYAIVKQVGKTNKTVRYQAVVVPLTEFQSGLDNLAKQGKITYFIKKD